MMNNINSKLTAIQGIVAKSAGLDSDAYDDVCNLLADIRLLLESPVVVVDKSICPHCNKRTVWVNDNLGMKRCFFCDELPNW